MGLPHSDGLRVELFYGLRVFQQSLGVILLLVELEEALHVFVFSHLGLQALELFLEALLNQPIIAHAPKALDRCIVVAAVWSLLRLYRWRNWALRLDYHLVEELLLVCILDKALAFT